MLQEGSRQRVLRFIFRVEFLLRRLLDFNADFYPVIFYINDKKEPFAFFSSISKQQFDIGLNSFLLIFPWDTF